MMHINIVLWIVRVRMMRKNVLRDPYMHIEQEWMSTDKLRPIIHASMSARGTMSGFVDGMCRQQPLCQW